MRTIKDIFPDNREKNLPDLSTLRDHVVRFFSIYTLAISTPLMAMAIYRGATVNWLWSTNLQVALYAILVGAALFGKKLKSSAVAYTILIIGVLAAASGCATWGIFANDASLLVGFSVLAAIFLGFRGSLTFVFIATAVSLVVGHAFAAGWLNYNFDEIAYLNSRSPWTNRTVNIAMIGVLVSLTVSWITKSLQKTIVTLKERESELEHSNQVLQDQTVQLEEQAALLEEQAEILKEERDKAKAASRAKDQFLSVVSHELRTPLNPVLGFLDIIKSETGLSEEAHNQIELMQKSSEHLLLMIDQIVDYSELDRGELSLKPQRTSLADLRRETIFRLANEAKSNRLDFQVDGEHPLEQDIAIDKKRLLQVITEVGNNAIKFTNKGGIRITLSTQHDQSTNATNLKIQVADTGIGIASDQLESIFDPFTQCQSDRTRTCQGFGLGLSFCQKIVSTLNGKIDIRSELGQGTTVEISIPTTSLPQEKQSNNAPEKSPQQFTSPIEILVVEDDLTNQKVVTTLLKRMGARTTCADNGKIALQTLEIRTFDAILMDLSMPEMDGITATRKIRQNSEYANIPIIALTAHSFASAEIECMDAGMNAFLTKPIKKPKLFETLAHVTTHSVNSSLN